MGEEEVKQQGAGNQEENAALMKRLDELISEAKKTNELLGNISQGIEALRRA